MSRSTDAVRKQALGVFERIPRRRSLWQRFKDWLMGRRPIRIAQPPLRYIGWVPLPPSKEGDE